MKVEELAEELYNEYHFPRPSQPWHYLDFNTKEKWKAVARYILLRMKVNT